MTIRPVAPRTVEPTADHPLMVTYEEAARILGGRHEDGSPKPVSVRHIERLVAAKKLKRKGRSQARRIVFASLLRYIEQEGDDG